MLYQRWLGVAQARAHEIALWDLPAGKRWTFRELAAEVDRLPGLSASVIHPQGAGPAFILDVLRAWKQGAVCCPIEAGQTPPPLKRIPVNIAHLKLTSATTGMPRLVTFTAEQLAADVDNIVSTMGLRPDWPNLGVISRAHSYGFSNLVTPLLLCGIPLALLDSPLPEAVRRLADFSPSITLPAVPAMWRAWHEAGAIPPNVRIAISAGAPLPLALERAVLERTGLKLHNFYGATECGGIAYDSTSEPRTDPACVGNAMDNVALRLNEHGCLEVRSAAVGTAYWPDPDPVLAPGCYRTSDLAELNNGLVFLRGRASDLINVAGRKVSPDSIERVLLGHESVRECLVFGASSGNSSRGEFIVACVVVPAGATEETLKQFLLARLPAWQVPREWKFVESLAPNARGKLSRAEWRARLGYT